MKIIEKTTRNVNSYENILIPTIHSILELFKTRRSGNGIRTHSSVLEKIFLALSTIRRRSVDCSPLRTCFDLCFDIVAI